MARPPAVIFDLFGTLVHELPSEEFWASVDVFGDALGADPAAFRRQWEKTSVERQTGAFPDIDSNVRWICDQLGVAYRKDGVGVGLDARRAMYDRWFRPRDGALETLSALRMRGYALALVSQCAPDTPPMWRASALGGSVDVEVFSSEVGLRKPDPSIYRLAGSRLGVPCEGCVYVGDGAYGELTGAATVGMVPYLLRDPELDHGVLLTPSATGGSARRSSTCATCSTSCRRRHRPGLGRRGSGTCSLLPVCVDSARARQLGRDLHSGPQPPTGKSLPSRRNRPIRPCRRNRTRFATGARSGEARARPC